VRKEFDEDLVTKNKQLPISQAAPPFAQYASPPQQQQQQPRPIYQQQPYQQQPQQPPQSQHIHRPGIPPGIPPSVSYSPTAARAPLAPPPPAVPGSGAGGARPDPPEAVGVTGYRQPPLRYIQGGGGRAGRGGRSVSGRGGRGRGGPRQPQFPGPAPPQQGYHHQGFYNNPPPSPHYTQGPGYGGGPPGAPRAPPWGGPVSFPPSPAPYSHHPQPQAQYPAQGPGPSGPPPPQSAQENGNSHGKQLGVKRFSQGLHQTADMFVNLAHQVAHPPVHRKGSAASTGFMPFQSTGTDFTMSDMSTFGGVEESLKWSANSGLNPGGGKAPAVVAMGGKTPIIAGPSSPKANKATANSNAPVNKYSSTTFTSSSSSKSRDLSFAMSDLMGSFGRTRSFPDLMLSSGDLLPPLPPDASDSDREGDKREGQPPTKTVGGRVLHNRQSSSGSSAGGQGPGVVGLNDAMSIMSIDSRRSQKSFRSETSWLDNFRSMQSVNSEQMKEDGMGMSLVRNTDDGSSSSVRSFLSDVSTELDALDLAEPLLPPIETDTGLNDSNADFILAEPGL